MFEKVANDDNYAMFRISSKAHLPLKHYKNCDVVAAPFTTGVFAGGAGWLFPKRSPFLPIFRQYFWQLSDAGLFKKIATNPEYQPFFLLPHQECETFNWHSVSIQQLAILFSTIVGGFGLSLLTFRYVDNLKGIFGRLLKIWYLHISRLNLSWFFFKLWKICARSLVKGCKRCHSTISSSFIQNNFPNKHSIQFKYNKTSWTYKCPNV